MVCYLHLYACRVYVIIYLDHSNSKAFDKVDLDLFNFMFKLKIYKFVDQIVNWIQAFLSHLDQVVVLDVVGLYPTDAGSPLLLLAIF